jgi:hypothetical protein
VSAAEAEISDTVPASRTFVLRVKLNWLWSEPLQKLLFIVGQLIKKYIQALLPTKLMTIPLVPNEPKFGCATVGATSFLFHQATKTDSCSCHNIRLRPPTLRCVLMPTQSQSSRLQPLGSSPAGFLPGKTTHRGRGEAVQNRWADLNRLDANNAPLAP